MKSRIVMLAAHEPQLDPRLDWEAAYAPEQFDVVLMGLHDSPQRRPSVERKGNYQIVRLDRAETGRLRCVRDAVRIMIPRWLQVVLGVLLLPIVAVLLLADLVACAAKVVLGPLAGWLFRRSILYRVTAWTFGRFRARVRGSMFAVFVRHVIECSHCFWSALGQMPLGEALVHCNDIDTLLVGVMAKRRFGCKLVYDCHEFYPYSRVGAARWEVRLFRAYEKWLIKHADRVFTVNHLLAREMMQTYRGVRIGSVPNAAPLGDTANGAGRARAGSSRDDRIEFLFQGNFCPERGIEELIGAWRLIDPARAVLLLRGKDNVYKQQCVQLAAGLGLLDSAVFFPEPVQEDQLVEAAACADVGVIPYKPICVNYRYCCPNKLSQFMQAGLPIMAAKTAFVGQVLAESGAGLVYDPGSPESIAAAVRDLAEDQDFRTECRENGRRYVRETFHWEQQSKPLYEAYAELLNANMPLLQSAGELAPQ